LSKSRDLRKKLDAIECDVLAKAHRFAADMAEIRRKLRKLRPSTASESISARDGVHPPVSRLREALRKGASNPDRKQEAPLEPAIIARDLRRRKRAARQPQEPDAPFVPLESVAAGTPVESAGQGWAYVIESPIGTLDEHSCRVGEAFAREITRADSNLRRWLSTVCGHDEFLPEDMLFIDLETTGLGTTPLFLIGTMVWDGDELVIRQYFARDYTEEPSAISIFLDSATGRKLWVSFNGKSYDLPYIKMRAAANRIPFALEPAHLDLLHECRRAWQDVVPDCKLRTLERVICGRERGEDIPGSEVPDVYHAYVRTQNAARIAPVLSHNILDLVTLAELMLKLGEAHFLQ